MAYMTRGEIDSLLSVVKAYRDIIRSAVPIIEDGRVVAVRVPFGVWRSAKDNIVLAPSMERPSAP